MKWEEVAGALESVTTEGWLLLDVLVFGTDREDWHRVYQAVRAAYPCRFDGVEGVPPTDARTLLHDGGPTLTIDPDGLHINCHFLEEDEIEFDIRSDAFASQAGVDRLCDFMALVGQAARKNAVLTVECRREAVILRYDRKTDCVSSIPHPG